MSNLNHFFNFIHLSEDFQQFMIDRMGTDIFTVEDRHEQLIAIWLERTGWLIKEEGDHTYSLSEVSKEIMQNGGMV